MSSNPGHDFQPPQISPTAATFNMLAAPNLDGKKPVITNGIKVSPPFCRRCKSREGVRPCPSCHGNWGSFNPCPQNCIIGFINGGSNGCQTCRYSARPGYIPKATCTNEQCHYGQIACNPHYCEACNDTGRLRCLECVDGFQRIRCTNCTEQTVYIRNHKMTELVRCASCVANGRREGILDVICHSCRGRRVVLCPDCGASRGWKTA